jgi:cell division protein FtsI (penicillin-binding protein 3)
MNLKQIFRIRLAVIAFIICILFLSLSFRLFALHLYSGGHRKESGSSYNIKTKLHSPRGRIFDRNGQLLALDIVQKNIYADPLMVVSNKAVAKASKAFSNILNIPAAILAERLNQPKKRFIFVAGYGCTISQEQSEYIESLNLPGIYTEDVLVRSYPNGSSMCHVLGFVNLAGDGSTGIELQLDKYLRSSPGIRVSQVDARGQELYDRRSLNIESHKGADVYLTIDRNIQYIAETALQELAAEHKPKAAYAIVQKVSNGAILAMANIPAFDLNEFRNSDKVQRRNRSVANVYEPGSTFKIITVSSAIDCGIVSPDDMFDCENGSWYYHGKPLNDYHAFEKLSVADILKKSSNIGAAKIALKLGNHNLYEYLRRYFIGRKLEIDLPGEQMGLLRSVNEWSKLSPTRIAMGYEVAVTALQMLNAMCTIANNGRLMRPYCIDSITTPEGKTVFKHQPMILSQPITEQTAVVMQKLLKRVTDEGGTGYRARVKGYQVAGKTGTAQKAVKGGYTNEYMASFVGFLPAFAPEIGIIVVVDEPSGSVHTGGTVAAPVFKQIAKETVNYLGISPFQSNVN